MLHIINQPAALENCLRFAKPGQAILFIENGVLAVLAGKLSTDYILYALKPDLIARGITDNLPSNIQLIDYDGFVDLVARYTPIQSWG